MSRSNALRPTGIDRTRVPSRRWRSMLARGIAVVGPTVQLELDVQAMYRTHDTPSPPEWASELAIL
ncbi:hypothetical protein ACIP17_12080 [Streptomyces iakyrus]|uniref:hypothetical protein n=1 Tax=Streptomyces iakyrus TaxID=68219 RepID=UPI0038039998